MFGNKSLQNNNNSRRRQYSPKGKPVLLTLQYIIKTISNHIKHLTKHKLAQHLQSKPIIKTSHITTPTTQRHTITRQPPTPHQIAEPERHTTQTPIRDITLLLKLLYNNNLHTHKAMSTISTIQNTKNTNYIQITILRKKLPTYQHEYPVLLSQLLCSLFLGCLPL